MPFALKRSWRQKAFVTSFSADNKLAKPRMFLHAVGRERYANLCERYKLYGLTLRVHGNKVGCQKNTYTFEAKVISEVSKFISNYAEGHALVLPGHVPDFKRSDV